MGSSLLFFDCGSQYGGKSPYRVQNDSLHNLAKVVCIFRVTHHEVVDGAVLQTELLRVCLDSFQNVLFLEAKLGMQTRKLFVRDRNARAIFCIGFFAAQHPVKDVLSCTENRLIVHHIGDNGSLTVNPPTTKVAGFPLLLWVAAF